MNNSQSTPTTLNLMAEREKNIWGAKIQILELHPGFGIFHCCNLIKPRMTKLHQIEEGGRIQCIDMT